ncbi:RNA polymerase sigma-70 factor [Dysgonomonas sp. 521]|uniref:RNA polymerase sigma-70 factor n=1 Tax=Dysgonomonas sp. 521 TaxID=2302932 RepID=UPI0013D6B51E|nr:RNA polymerase sigma-70 factor [Dysgonomonas sp. 521]NDV95332.1 RNA polymerase sigma-70 factor [Dysgonomonas sp. 521]
MFARPQVDINQQTGDPDLFSLMQKGNKEAFTVIYNKYHKQLYVLAYTYLKDRDMAEDAIQHIFTKLWEFREDVSIKVSLKNFLYTITKNYILNQIRNENTIIKKNYELAQTAEIYQDDLLNTIEQKELMTIFRQALAALPEQKRQVCLLKMDEKMSNQEIADKMQISINTVKTHYAQAIKILRAQMGKMLISLIIIILF